jgi:putative DeoR family transcriptional regulator, stage III sporulation protein D
VICLNREIRDRVLSIANDILVHQETIRNIAEIYQVSKSTVHKDLSERLYDINQEKYEEVKKLLDYNKSVRHIRGGNSTKIKYLIK